MADLDALKNDVEHVLKLIPHEVVRLLAAVAQKVLDEHRAALNNVIPEILDKLKPHAMALMGESAMGLLDTAELEATLTTALANVVNAAEPAHASAG